MNNIYISVFSILISICAVIISIINYRRSLKLQNENIIYSKKLEAYIEFSCHLWALIKKHEEIEVLVLEKPNTVIQKVEKLIDGLEILEDKFNDTIIKYALVSDEKIGDALLALTSTNEFPYNYDTYSEERIKNATNSFIEKADAVFDSMEEDLAIDNLSKGLASRIKSIPSKKARNKTAE